MRAFGPESFSMMVVAQYDLRADAYRHEAGLISFLRSSGQNPYNVVHNHERKPRGTSNYSREHAGGDDPVREAVFLDIAEAGGLTAWCSKNNIGITGLCRYVNYKRQSMPADLARHMGIPVSYPETNKQKRERTRPRPVYDRPPIDGFILSSYVFAQSSSSAKT